MSCLIRGSRGGQENQRTQTAHRHRHLGLLLAVVVTVAHVWADGGCTRVSSQLWLWGGLPESGLAVTLDA